MKKIILFGFLVITLFAVTVSASGAYWWKLSNTPPSQNAQKVRVTIPRGSSITKIAQILKDEKVIRSQTAFVIFAKLNQNTSKIPPGEFNISQNQSLSAVVSTLLKGPEEIWITFKEGLRKEEIVEKAVVELNLTKEKQDLFASEFLEIVADKEGYLFPDTYLVPVTTTPQKLATIMLDTFDKKFANKMQAQIAASAYSLEEIVTLASLLERETKTKTEKPTVAGIYENRMKSDWPLQVDATVQYAIASKTCRILTNCKWWPTITREDYELESNLNTYKILGLPNTPIANPGLSSLEAALSPADSDYFFYIHDNTGKIYYAETLEKHNANVAKYLR